MRALIALALVACRDPVPPPGSPADLAAYLDRVARADHATRAAEIAGWKLDRATWERTIVEPFRGRYTSYADHFADRVPEALLPHGGAITARRHYAGDPRLTAGQAILRWALPVQYPSAVAELDGVPIDTVFIHDGVRWRALVNFDELVIEYVQQFAEGIQPLGGDQPQVPAPPCLATLLQVQRSDRCASAWFTATDAALRNDRTRFDRMCRLATSLCDMRSP